MKIAIISSASPQISEENKKNINNIICLLEKVPNITILTGASLGIPGYAILQAKNKKINTVAYSPDINSDDHHRRHDNLELSYFDEINHYQGFTERSLKMIQDADCILTLNGRIGTLSEFTIALEEGKKVAVITGTGGISDHLEKIINLGKKDFSKQLFFSKNINEVINYLIYK